jgi:hypothetical protein
MSYLIGRVTESTPESLLYEGYRGWAVILDSGPCETTADSRDAALAWVAAKLGVEVDDLTTAAEYSEEYFPLEKVS